QHVRRFGGDADDAASRGRLDGDRVDGGQRDLAVDLVPVDEERNRERAAPLFDELEGALGELLRLLARAFLVDADDRPAGPRSEAGDRARAVAVKGEAMRHMGVA